MDNYHHSGNNNTMELSINYKIFIPWMNRRTTIEYVTEAINRLNIGTIKNISMHKKYKNGPYYTCMIEFSSVTQKGFNALFQFIDNPRAKIQIKHKHGYWHVKKFNVPKNESIEVMFLKTPEKCVRFEETYPDYNFLNEEAIYFPRTATPDQVLAPPSTPYPFFIENEEPKFRFPLESEEITLNLLWDEFPLYHFSKKFD
jgi:hypothetical protein